MMYHQKFVLAIKANGKVLREFGDKVFLPWGTEYSILLKNQSSVRAEARVTIDGQDVLNGSALIVGPNKSLDLERFLKDQDRGNRFKFIERTQSIEDGPRGIKIDDGLIRVEWQFEKVLPKTTFVDNHIYHRDVHHWPSWPSYDRWYGPGYYGSVSNSVVGSAGTNDVKCAAGSASGSTLRSASLNNTVTTQSARPWDGTAACSDVKSYVSNDVGITAPGSISDQKFETVMGFPLETETFSMVIHLCGETEENKQVVKAVTVKAKPVCITCGKTNKASHKFCAECGTALEVV